MNLPQDTRDAFQQHVQLFRPLLDNVKDLAVICAEYHETRDYIFESLLLQSVWRQPLSNDYFYGKNLHGALMTTKHDPIVTQYFQRLPSTTLDVFFSTTANFYLFRCNRRSCISHCNCGRPLLPLSLKLQQLLPEC